MSRCTVLVRCCRCLCPHAQPKEITAIKEFLQTLKRKETKQVKVKKTKKNGVVITKFKVRCARYLYTLKLDNEAKAKRLQSSLPPNTTVVEL